MIVFKHLFTLYRKVYAIFLALLALMLIVSVVNPWHVELWQPGGSAAPPWFVFSMGLTYVTASLPVILAHGITRREYFRGAVSLLLVMSAVAAVVVVAGLGVEGTIGSWAQAGRLGLESFIDCAAYGLSGWLAGIVFYRLSVWIAIACTLLAAMPIIAVSARPLGQAAAGELALTGGASVIAVLVGYLLVRGVAIRPRKA